MTETLRGVFLPIVTPFTGDEVDFDSYRRLLRHYLEQGISGLIPLGTTGEAPTVEETEFLEVVEATVETVGSRVPVIVGISSASTRKALHAIEGLARFPVQGYLVTSPYYNLPSQQGIYEHFKALAGATDRRVLVYNIPYRTGRNVENETILRLSEVPNIAGIKDSCGNIGQTLELLRERDPVFAVFTGEDILFYANLVHGGSGGILASAHLRTADFLRICELVSRNDHRQALQVWNGLARFIPLLFREPNPAPLKYVLARKGLIRSEEVRPPLAPISQGLKAALDALISQGAI